MQQDSTFWIVFGFVLHLCGLAAPGAMEVGLTNVCSARQRNLCSHTGQYDTETLRKIMLVEMMMAMENMFVCVFQVCMRRYLREICVLLHLTGECHIRGHLDCFWSLHSKVTASYRLLLLNVRCLYEIYSIPNPTVD